jgi:hypothetical protein
LGQVPAYRRHVPTDQRLRLGTLTPRHLPALEVAASSSRMEISRGVG